MDLISRKAVEKTLSDSINKHNEELLEISGTSEDTDHFNRINSRLVEDKEISVEVSKLPSAFEGMTNRDVLKALFPIDENKGTRFTKVYLDHEAIESFELLTTQKWLDSPYKGVRE